MPILRPLIRLVRLDSSLLGFLAIFLPLVVRTGDAPGSFRKGLPLLFICMCTFIANDLNDIETDKINRPRRPLPTGEIRPVVATILYFLGLGLGLFSARAYVDEKIAFWYYGLFLVSVSYSFIVDYIPALKAPYVGLASLIPVLIVAAFFPEKRFYVVACSVFLVTLGRELCLGIKDRSGDNHNALTRLNALPLSLFAFFTQAVGLCMLITQIETLRDGLVMVGMLILLAVSAIFWFRSKAFDLAQDARLRVMAT